MIIIPAVDIYQGKCVRLKQGAKNTRTVFSDDPVAMALKWEGEGAEIIHVVDLDGAFEKEPKNISIILSMQHRLRIPIQVGGGIRTESAIRIYLEAGISRVIIGTEAINNPELVISASSNYPNRILVGIDARNGWAAVDGWTRIEPVRAVDVANRFKTCPLAGFVFTDISRDGMGSGVNIDATREFASSVSVPVIASGGVASIDDIKMLLPLERAGVTGVITGKAIYTGNLDLKEAILLAGNTPSSDG
ncbi:MAG: 1-(5-phosphoribosyl)-5-[(5-phosphoribosylamino)methylideneamino]imidazole-4-carboxamide isomerase [Thermodesulfobacteriota bacterium]